MIALHIAHNYPRDASAKDLERTGGPLEMARLPSRPCYQAARERRRRQTSQGPSVTASALTHSAFGVEKKRPKKTQPSAPPTNAAPAPSPTVHHPGCALPRPYAPSPQRAACASHPASAPSSAQISVSISRSTDIILRSSSRAHHEAISSNW